MSPQGGILNFSVIANVDFKVDINADWITQTNTRFLTEQSLQFNIEENTAETLREAIITLSFEDLVQNIKIIQAESSNTGGDIEDMPIQPW